MGECENDKSAMTELLYERNKEKRECVCEGEERKNVWVSVRMTKVL